MSVVPSHVEVVLVGGPERHALPDRDGPAGPLGIHQRDQRLEVRDGHAGVEAGDEMGLEEVEELAVDVGRAAPPRPAAGC